MTRAYQGRDANVVHGRARSVCVWGGGGWGVRLPASSKLKISSSIYVSAVSFISKYTSLSAEVLKHCGALYVSVEQWLCEAIVS